MGLQKHRPDFVQTNRNLLDKVTSLQALCPEKNLVIACDNHLQAEFNALSLRSAEQKVGMFNKADSFESSMHNQSEIKGQASENGKDACFLSASKKVFDRDQHVRRAKAT